MATTTEISLIISGVPDIQDVPFSEEASFDDVGYAHLMRRIGIAEGEPGAAVSAFNSSI
jgi:hypothetical protein